MRRIYLVPTGNEILQGIVLDTDSPELLRQLIRRFPEAMVTRFPPIADQEQEIAAILESLLQEEPELIVFIGGSGGGHRYSASLGKDFTQSALERCLKERAIREIYGKNGHLWTKLICGRKGKSLIINVPGPFVEAKAAITAFLAMYDFGGRDLSAMNQAMAEAVFRTYPTGGAEIHEL
jgi:molybdopterin biosynthesis enzyme